MSRGSRVAPIAALVAAICLLAPIASRAESGSRAGARDLIQALELIQQQRCDAAIPLLRRAWEVGNLRNAQWNLAECHALSSRPRLAIESYRRYMGHVRTSDTDREAARAAIESIEATLVTLLVESNVEGARVQVDGHDEGGTPLTLEIGPGDHIIEVSSPGFDPWQENLQAGPGERYRLEATLQLRPGTLSAATEPTGAELYVDGELLGTTPYVGVLPSGGHVVELRLEGYRNSQRRVVLQPGRESTTSVSLQPLEGTLALATNAPGAVLIVDGEERGRSPFTPIRIAPGRYELEVHAEDHTSWSGEVDVFDRQSSLVELELGATRGLHQAWFWSLLGVTVGTLAGTLAMYLASDQHRRAYDDHVDFIENDASHPLEMAEHRRAGEEELDLARDYSAGALAMLAAMALSAVASFVVGIFTRWSRPETTSRITFDAIEAADDTTQPSEGTETAEDGR